MKTTDLKGDTAKRGDQSRSFGRLDSNDPPSWLDREAKAYWRRIAPALAADGILNPVTADLLSTAAAAYSVYREAQKKLRDEGRVIETHTGARKSNPWLSVEKQAWEQLARVYKILNLAGPVVVQGDELDDFLREDS